MAVCVPYPGTSTQRQSAQTLTDRQAGLVARLAEDCRAFDAAGEVEQAPEKRGGGGREFIAGRANAAVEAELAEEAAALLRAAGGEVQQFRRRLPSHGVKEDLLAAVRGHQVVVVSGETGCGKTTQVPQFILDDAVARGEGSKVSVVCTQPRRVAAISVAERVAKERGQALGRSVGFQVRMEHRQPRAQGGILYCTAGILLQRMTHDRALRQFSHVVLDEVHERDVMADLILVILKQVLPSRPDLRVVLMSATLNASVFSEYLGGCPTLHIPGFMYPVVGHYLEEVLALTDYSMEEGWRHAEEPRAGAPPATRAPAVLTPALVERMVEEQGLGPRVAASLLHPKAEDLCIDLVANLVSHIHREMPEGAILVFLPGWEDINSLSALITSSFMLSNVSVLPLHGSMNPTDQRLIFERPAAGTRKVVIATNIAESSVTIDDVVYVVDCGRAKMKMFDPAKNFATLQPEWISRANAKQRMGRAGRLRPGHVYRLYSRAREAAMEEFMVPEIRRSRLENVILKILVLGYTDVDSFLSELLDPPSRESVALSNQALRDIGALDSAHQLTGLGHTLGQLPLDPQLGKMMVLAAALSCLDPVLSVVTALENKSPFCLTTRAKESAAAMDRMAADTASDHLAVANAVACWDGLQARGLGGQARTTAVMEFTHSNFLSTRVLGAMERMKYQYSLELHKLGLTPSPDMTDPALNRNSGCEALVRAVIAIGLVPNVATLREEEAAAGRAGHRLVTARGQSLEFHPRSVNRNVMKAVSGGWGAAVPRWFTFFEKMHSSDTFIHDSTATGPLCLLLLASNITFALHPSPTTDPAMEQGTKKRLGVLFHNPGVQVYRVLVTAGDSSIQLFLCSEETVEQVQLVRRVLGGVLEQRCRGGGGGRWGEGAHHKVLARLVSTLNSDREAVL